MTKNLYIPIAIVFAGIIIGLSIFVGRGVQSSQKVNEIAGLPQGQEQEVQNPVDFAVADTDPSLGNPDAPVTIIEFGDFECPFCKKFSLETKPQLEKNEINEGKVRLIWKDFPLSIHSRAEAAHEAARCAQDQGKFWEYHDLLYANQQQLGKNDLKKYATELRLDTKEFNECVDSRRFSNLVAEGLAEGTAAGVRGTPSFLINGRLVVGALPYATFSQAIEDAFKR